MLAFLFLMCNNEFKKSANRERKLKMNIETANIETLEVTRDQQNEMLRQIGRMNVMAISGGRAVPLKDGVELPVGSGYRVRVRLLANDTYRVERVFVRGSKTFEKGFCENVYCDEIGDIAYYASCFRNDSGQWTYGNPSA